jgi:hypothetical protein
MKIKLRLTAFLMMAAPSYLWAETSWAGDESPWPRTLREDADPGTNLEAGVGADPTDLAAGDSEAPSLPLALWTEPQPVLKPEFSLGAAVGFLHAKGADRGTWFAGVQGRLHFLTYFAAEASITFHENRYEHGDVHVTQYPVQLSGMFYPIPDGEFRPYVLGGGGWYYTRITYTGVFSGVSNQTDHAFGGHVGAGLEVRLGPKTSIDADLRYIWLNPSSRVVNRSDFDYWQVTGGINLFF